MNYYQYNEDGKITSHVRGDKAPICERQFEREEPLPKESKIVRDGKVYLYSYDEEGQIVLGEELCSL